MDTLCNSVLPRLKGKEDLELHTFSVYLLQQKEFLCTSQDVNRTFEIAIEKCVDRLLFHTIPKYENDFDLFTSKIRQMRRTNMIVG